jgi:hypothetical protein
MALTRLEGAIDKGCLLMGVGGRWLGCQREKKKKKVIGDHFEKISSIYRKQILKMIADHF